MFFITCIVADIQHNTKNGPEIDEKLFDEIGKGSTQALEQLYNLTERIVYSYALSLVGSHQDAADIVSDTYIKISKAAHLYKPMGKPLAWIFTIEKNLARDLIKLRSKTDSIEDYPHLSSQSSGDMNSFEDKIVLNTALSILTKEERTIILLHAVSGIKHREIAQSIGMPLSTVLSKYHRGLKKLKNKLAEGGDYQ